MFVGWAGDHSLRQACLEISKPFAESLGLKEGEQVEAVAHAAPIASSVMVQPIFGCRVAFCAQQGDAFETGNAGQMVG